MLSNSFALLLCEYSENIHEAMKSSNGHLFKVRMNYVVPLKRVKLSENSVNMFYPYQNRDNRD